MINKEDIIAFEELEEKMRVTIGKRLKDIVELSKNSLSPVRFSDDWCFDRFEEYYGGNAIDIVYSDFWCGDTDYQLHYSMGCLGRPN